MALHCARQIRLGSYDKVGRARQRFSIATKVATSYSGKKKRGGGGGGAGLRLGRHRLTLEKQ